MKPEIPKTYNASDIEDSIYKAWEDSGFFNPDNLPGERKEAFTISMPPPNATGILHIGHAMFLTIQDAVTRYQRMLGKKALWVPGTDHAAIATNAKVERILKNEGKDKYDLGREKFLERVDEFVQDKRITIQKQIRKMGSSCDWSRERFTLDEGLSHAVRTAFVNMYNDGLIYRGNRIVNWCPHCESTLSDDEVEYKEEKTKFYYFKYGPIVIGTARPETKFLDKTIVVHPKDDRYKDIMGKEFDVEWIDGKVRANVLADEVVDKDFGTGAMTITPAHSFEDFDLAQKYKLPVVRIIDEKGNFTKAAGEFSGKNARESRDDIVNILDKKGLVEKIDDDYFHNLSVCYRCGTPVEPLTKEQWFVDVNKRFRITNSELRIPKKEASLKELALHVVRSGQIKFIPQRFEKTYYHWMENLRDWCISRQIWYGHRIPVWYCVGGDHCKLECKDPIVSIDPPKKCPHCDSENLRQDPDTLDTWFSSGLWTFSTLGWPEQTDELKTFHPTNLMETGYDIIFFWVARMILMSTYHMKEIPFSEVYLHGLVRDEQGRKMSKSLDNILDPLEIIPKFGTDAIRLSLLIGITPGNDSNLGESKIAGYRNFVNKLWNISRYVLTTVELKVVDVAPEPKTLADAWILEELSQLINYASDGMDNYRFSQVGEAVYEFTWSKFADWYLEIAKVEKDKDDILNYVLQSILKLWHPFTPFVSEEIWKNFAQSEKDFLMVQTWPKARKTKDSQIKQHFSLVQEVITKVRNMKAENKIPAGKKVDVVLSGGASIEILEKESENIKNLARIENLEFGSNIKQPEESASDVVSDVHIYLILSGIIDKEAEKQRAQKEFETVSKYVASLEKKIGNDSFVRKAPSEIVDVEKRKLFEAQEKMKKLQASL